MRSIIILILICFSISVSRSQTYDWPQTGWHQGAVHVGDWTTGFAESNATYWVAGDTTIGTSTFRVMKSSFWSDTWLKYDSGKIYKVYTYDTTIQQVLYDFTVGMGDTLNTPGYLYYGVVDSVGTVLLPNGVNAKYIRFEAGHEWVEGIGDIYRAFLYYQDFEGGHEIEVCTYDENGIQINSNPNANYDCDSLLTDAGIATGINDFAVTDINIYPNPSTGNITIDHLSNSGRINLFDINGRKVLSEELVLNNQTVDLTTLPNGIYLITVVLDNGQMIEDKVVLVK